MEQRALIALVGGVALMGLALGCDRAEPTAASQVAGLSAHLSGSSGAWSSPVNLGPVINSTFNDFGPGISRDGLSLYFSSDRPGGSGGVDIWVAHRADEDAPWGVPVNLGPTVNTSAAEVVPTFSRDGHRMFFVSTRADGFGGNDIWVSFREDAEDDFGWQTPVNLGSAINTSFGEAGPSSVRVDGAEFLFFSSNRPGGLGGSVDIYVSARQEDGSFGPPTLVAELNSTAQDQRPAVRRDGREVFFFSNRAGSLGAPPRFDLWTSTRESPEVPWSTPVNLGPIVNSTAAEFQPALARDGRTLFFASNRPGGFGDGDLYMITREKPD